MKSALPRISAASARLRRSGSDPLDMAVMVVERLEVIGVDHHHRRGGVVQGSHRLGEALLEGRRGGCRRMPVRVEEASSISRISVPFGRNPPRQNARR